jgi:hypothetical protein
MHAYFDRTSKHEVRNNITQNKQLENKTALLRGRQGQKP